MLYFTLWVSWLSLTVDTVDIKNFSLDLSAIPTCSIASHKDCSALCPFSTESIVLCTYWDEISVLFGLCGYAFWQLSSHQLSEPGRRKIANFWAVRPQSSAWRCLQSHRGLASGAWRVDSQLPGTGGAFKSRFLLYISKHRLWSNKFLFVRLFFGGLFCFGFILLNKNLFSLYRTSVAKVLPSEDSCSSGRILDFQGDLLVLVWEHHCGDALRTLTG